MELKKSLAPVIFPDSRVLILGSMPGEESLRRQQYYAHPANHFWRLIAEVTEYGCCADGISLPPQDYDARLRMLAAGGIALWDVIASCTREGSLDTKIRNEVPNNLEGMLSQYSAQRTSEEGAEGVRAVFFNGQKAAASFKRSFGFELLGKYGLAHGILPSSSPANTIGFEKKLEEWLSLREYLMI